METDVRSLKRILSVCKEEGDGDSTRSGGGGLITRDLLGGSTVIRNRDELELDLHLKLPCKWEKHLDLGLMKNMKNNIEDSCLQPKSISQDELFQDLNLRPPNLELKLFPSPPLPSSSSSSSPPSTAPFRRHCNKAQSRSNIHSVCTLDKVKSALARAGRKNTSSKMDSPTSSSTNNSKSLVEEEDGVSKSFAEEEEEEEEAGEEESKSFATLVAAGCPCCLSYVLISKNNPTCPRCFSDIPPPPKKPRVRIDLNANANEPFHGSIK